MNANPDDHCSEKSTGTTKVFSDATKIVAISNGGELTSVEKNSSQKRKKTMPQSSSKKKCSTPVEWKPYEKTALLKMLTEIEQEGLLYFSDDLDSLDQFTKKLKEKCGNSSITRGVDEIKKLLLRYIRECQKEHFKHDSPVDKWLEIVRALTPLNKSLEQQLKSAIMVAIEEPIPDLTKKVPSDLDKKMPVPDFASLYKYLACAVSGLPLPELSPIDSLVIEDCMQSLMEQIKSLEDNDLRLNLRKVYLHLNKQEGQLPEEEQEDIINQLSKGSVHNPLGINQNLIVPVPPD